MYVLCHPCATYFALKKSHYINRSLAYKTPQIFLFCSAHETQFWAYYRKAAGNQHVTVHGAARRMRNKSENTEEGCLI